MTDALLASALGPSGCRQVLTGIETRNPVVVAGDSVRIMLCGGNLAVIDLADLPAVAHLRWSPDGNGYARTRMRRGGMLVYPRLHRYLLGEDADGWYVDHRNGLRWDSRRANLRLCTQAQNVLNRAPNVANRTGFKGVRRRAATGRYFIQIKARGQQYRVGDFDTPAEAARGYDFLAQSLFGPWARLNFPESAE